MNPERIGPYIIDKKVGAGGMGTVYRGHHADTEQVVAVKVLPASLAREEGFVSRFEREIEAMKKVKNRHIVEFYDSGVTEDKTYYYAMEYVEGETLTLRLTRRKRIQWREVIDLTCQMCGALKAAHNAGVIHRDLKPSNLMISGEGVVKLTDFGVAHVFASTRLTRTGGIVGTAEYMSPEQAAGKRATKRSDLYSLGAVMYAMLTGRPPFTGKTSADITHKHIYGQFDKPSRYSPDIPHEVEEVVIRLLEKDPEQRYPDALVLQKALEQIQKRIDYRIDKDITRVGDSEVGPNGEAATAADNRSERRSITDEGDSTQAHSAHSGRDVGSATMMRDLMRAEFEDDSDVSLVSRLLDNIWVLIGLLALVIAGGFYFVRGDSSTTGEETEVNGEVVTAETDSKWLRALNRSRAPLSQPVSYTHLTLPTKRIV